MRIFLRVLIILMLLVAGVALWLGILLFDQREELRGRVERLETRTMKLATYIETDQSENIEETDLPTVQLQHNDLKVFYRLDNEGKPLRDAEGVRIDKGPGTLDDLLNSLISKADLQLMRLNETRLKLTDTRLVLEKTQAILKKTEQDLRIANRTIDDLKDTISDRNEEIATKDVEIETLNEEKDELNAQIETQAENIAELEDKRQELENKLAQADKYISQLLEEIERLRAAEQGSPVLRLTKGRQGEIVSVNPDWNFVVLGIPSDSALAPGVELLVQRGATFVGRVRVLKVKDDENIAIADILNDWQQLPMQKGDYVLY